MTSNRPVVMPERAHAEISKHVNSDPSVAAAICGACYESVISQASVMLHSPWSVGFSVECKATRPSGVGDSKSRASLT